MSANRKAVSTFLDLETVEIFEALCTRRGLSRYAAIKQAISDWMGKNG